jgi:hypothetical protein
MLSIIATLEDFQGMLLVADVISCAQEVKSKKWLNTT